MRRLITLKEASELTGLSITSLRRGIHSGRFPAVRANTSQGKLLINEELLQEVLRNEAINNLRNCNMGKDTPEPKAQPRSYLADLFKDDDMEKELKVSSTFIK